MCAIQTSFLNTVFINIIWYNTISIYLPCTDGENVTLWNLLTVYRIQKVADIHTYFLFYYYIRCETVYFPLKLPQSFPTSWPTSWSRRSWRQGRGRGPSRWGGRSRPRGRRGRGPRSAATTTRCTIREYCSRNTRGILKLKLIKTSI